MLNKGRASIGRSSPRNKAKTAKQTVAETKPAITNFSDTETEDYTVNDKPNTSINGQAALEYSRGSRLLKKSFSNRFSAATRSTTLATSTTKEDSLPATTLARNDSFSSDDSVKRSGGVGYSIKTPISAKAFKLFNRSSTLSNYSDSENEETNILNDNNRKEATTFTENITKRLLRHRPKSATNNSTTSKSTASNNKDTYLTTKFLNNQPVVSQASPTETVQLTADSYSSQSNWISYGILIAGILFFAFIFSFYFYSRYFSAAVSSAEEAELSALEKEFDFSIHDLNIPGCMKNESTGICSTSQIRPVLLIIKEMKKIVDKKLTNHYCSSPPNESRDNPYEYSIKSLKSQIEMSIGSSIVEMTRQTRSDKTKATEPSDLFLSLFANALDLLDNNSKWYIKPVGENGRFEKIVVDPNYPKTLHTTCQVKLFMIKTFWYFVTLVTISVFGCLVYFYVNYIKNQALKEKELLFELVEKSIELLQSPDEPQSLPILHIRDMLLDPQQRKQPFYQKIWDQVVQFIENNESRIKSSLENIDGEDYKTWKWVATTKNQPDSTGMKANQIDYNPFSDDNTSDTTIQTPPAEKASRTINTSTPIKNNTSVISSSQMKDFVALTRFLKVRNMIDRDTVESDDWKVLIQNEIIRRCCNLSKDGKTHGVQHMHVDDRNVNDGLVYIKCDSIENASNAFKALHGSTFSDNEKRPISVKFLKEERYVFCLLSNSF